MSASIITSAKPVKINLEALLNELRQIHLTPLDQKLKGEALRQQNEFTDFAVPPSNLMENQKKVFRFYFY